MPVEFLAAEPDMAPAASALIYLTMDKMADHLFGADRARGMLQRLFRTRRNRFSYQFTDVVSEAGQVTGLVVAYSGRTMHALELPMAARLLQSGGLLGFVRFVRRAVPLIHVREAEPDEYFISNIAVLPERQGQGLGQYMLAQIELRAKAQGFKKLSLTVDVDNERATALYRRIGFDLLGTVVIERLQQSIGYHGFHRMVKSLA